ncbi:EamA family transporter [Chromobacterium amazonense]|uniref:EamA family transporter n=1 Tax=Chromobacterium amazonense TaxID=1382803 RepID=UPI003B968BA0
MKGCEQWTRRRCACPSAWWNWAYYLGALGSALAYIWYYDGIKQIGPTRSGTFIALNPLTAVLLGAALLGESLTPTMAAGGALAIAGIVLCNLAIGPAWRKTAPPVRQT